MISILIKQQQGGMRQKCKFTDKYQSEKLIIDFK